MERDRTWGVVLGTALLGVLGTAAAVTAVLFGVAAWAVEGQGLGWDIGASAIVVVALLLVVYAVAAFAAAWAVWVDRAFGRPVGLAVALIGALAAVVALLQNAGEQTIPVLALAILVALLAAAAQLVPARAPRMG